MTQAGREAAAMTQCTCPPEAIAGSYLNQEQVCTPSGKIVGVDLCILPDVTELWRSGINTIESCCGHGRTTGYIAVYAEHESSMLNLGYKRDPRTDAPGCFLWPKDENPVTVGKVYACEVILRSAVADDQSNLVRAWKALQAIIDSRGWEWAHILRNYRGAGKQGEAGIASQPEAGEPAWVCDGLSDEMIEAGIAAWDAARSEMEAREQSSNSETHTDWDEGMIVAAIFKAMAASQPEAARRAPEDCSDCPTPSACAHHGECLAHPIAAVERVFAENIIDQASRIGAHAGDTETPGQWMQRVRMAALLEALAAPPQPPADPLA